MSHELKSAEVVDCPPLPCRGSRKSVNWAPQFSPPQKDQTLTRRSSRLSYQASPSRKLNQDCELLMNSSIEKIVSKDEEAPNCIESNTSPQGKRQHETPAAGPAEQNGAQMSPSKATICSNSNSLSRDQEVGGEDTGKEDRKDGDHGMETEESRDWVSVPLNDMETRLETVTNARTRYQRKCQKLTQYRVPPHRNKTVKRETGQKIVIRNVSAVRAKLPSKNGSSERDDQTVVTLREMATTLNGVIYNVRRMVQTSRERTLRRTHAGTSQTEAIAKAAQQKLRDEISKLKRKNQVIQTAQLRIKRDRDRLKKDYLGLLDSTKEAQRLHADREDAKAVAAALTDELAREREKNSCQICFNVPRDALVLPCMHFQYCNECLQKHQRRNAECPTCRGKISGVLRCKLGTT